MKRIQLKLQGEDVYPITIGSTTGSMAVGYHNPYPKNAKVYITSELLSPNPNDNTISPLTTTKNVVGDLDNEDVSIKFVSDSVAFEDFITMAYQGNTSLQKPKKGFSIDTKEKHKFAEWLEMDSFHLKGYYSDWMHARDICANRIIEQVYLMRKPDIRRPYMIANDFPQNFANRADCGVLCHIDGFCVELYINDVYWGIYSLNIKKNRSNYLLSKNNTNHVQIEAANDDYYTVASFADGGNGWRNLEIRNPKSDSGNSSFDEGVEPNSGEVKTEWQSFISKINAISVNTTKTDLEAFLNVQDWIDGILLTWLLNHTDNWCKNTLYTTWDSVHWSPLLYDLDNSFGIVSTDGDNALSSDYNTLGRKAYTYCPWLSILENILNEDIKARYKELRELGVFTTKNVINVLESWTKSVGYDNYKRDLNRWTYPSNGGNANHFYDGITRISDWIDGRLIYLDNKYNYNV